MTRKIDPEARDLAERLWRGALRWADRSIRPRFIALVTEWLSGAPPAEQDEELTPREEERVEAALQRLHKRQQGR